MEMAGRFLNDGEKPTGLEEKRADFRLKTGQHLFAHLKKLY